jgi:hypothetical protein
LHTPTVFHLNDNETVTITLFDANHCPGAVMHVKHIFSLLSLADVVLLGFLLKARRARSFIPAISALSRGLSSL